MRRCGGTAVFVSFSIRSSGARHDSTHFWRHKKRPDRPKSRGPRIALVLCMLSLIPFGLWCSCFGCWNFCFCCCCLPAACCMSRGSRWIYILCRWCICALAALAPLWRADNTPLCGIGDARALWRQRGRERDDMTFGAREYTTTFALALMEKCAPIRMTPQSPPIGA